MPLETGNFIPELDPNNPLGSDQKSEGDDHLRVLKRATQGSFPAFVGNTATPKSVTLTEDEINDAALKSAAAAISGAWQFDTPPLLSNAIALLGRDVADAVSHALLSLSAADIATIGNDDTDAELRAQINTDLIVGGVLSAAVVTLALGGLLVSDLGGTGKKAGFRNPTNVTFSTSQTPDQTWEGTNRQCTGGNPTLTIDQLEAFTAFRVINTSSSVTLTRGTVTNMRWLDGSGVLRSVTGALIATGSIVEFYWQSPTTMYIFGNGITEI